jgi:hypothetical protein
MLFGELLGAIVALARTCLAAISAAVRRLKRVSASGATGLLVWPTEAQAGPAAWCSRTLAEMPDMWVVRPTWPAYVHMRMPMPWPPPESPTAPTRRLFLADRGGRR